MDKFEFWNYNEFEFITSPNSIFIIIKLNNVSGDIKQIANLVNDELKVNYLDRPGVYFLKLEDGYYIGETKDLHNRLSTHIKNREIRTITFATYKSEIDHLDKEKIRDLESILISYAEDSGLMLGEKLKNKKYENRKTSNFLNAKENTMSATYIWDKFSYLNLKDILEDRNVETSKDKIMEDATKEAISIKKREKYINTFGVMANVKDHEINENHDIFKYVSLRKVISKGYSRDRIEIFIKELAKDALFMYLYESIGNGTIDKELTKERRVRGWVTAVTLAYLRIETNGETRGSLNEKMTSVEAKELINNFVEENYC